MTQLLMLLALTGLLICPVRIYLSRASWPTYAPRAAILLWQAIGTAVCIAIIGACVQAMRMAAPPPNPRRHITDLTGSTITSARSQSSAPDHLYVLTVSLVVAALLIGLLLSRTIAMLRARIHQRVLVDLLGKECIDDRGTFVVDHPVATAFSVPGLHPRVVVSQGAVEALSVEELAAVIAHERSHVRAHHDLVLLPFRSLGLAIPWSSAIASVNNRIATLVEMAADDRAIRQCGQYALVSALCRMSDTGIEISAEESTGAMVRRVERLLSPRPSATAILIGSGLASAMILTLPFVVLLASFGRSAL